MEKTISEIRKEFFAFRNGVLATRLRESGDPHAVIMGCLLADVVSIARRYEPSVELAEALWADVKHRECRLAAPMLFPPSEMEREQAMEWARGVQSEEEADVLCHRLLRRVTGAEEMACEFLDVLAVNGNLTVQRTDVTNRHRLSVAESVTDGNRHLADLHLIGVADSGHANHGRRICRKLGERNCDNRQVRGSRRTFDSCFRHRMVAK